MKDADFNDSIEPFVFPVNVEISGFVLDKTTNEPLEDIEIVLEVMKNINDLVPAQVETGETDEDGKFSVDISAISGNLRLKAIGAPHFSNGEIIFYLAPNSVLYDEAENEYEVENQVIYLERI